ncbi:MAG: hypothetical protein J7467_08060, partial [Chloroflexus sp.]|nr:hypothetical protein [Chloroflexus sp.]
MKTRRSLSVFLHLFVLVALTLVGCAAPPETSTVPTQQTQPATAAPTTQDGIPLAFADPNKKVRIALVREVGEGSFF